MYNFLPSTRLKGDRFVFNTNTRGGGGMQKQANQLFMQLADC